MAYIIGELTSWCTLMYYDTILMLYKILVGYRTLCYNTVTLYSNVWNDRVSNCNTLYIMYNVKHKDIIY